MRKSTSTGAVFEVLDNNRARVVGILDFATVAHLLSTGAAAIDEGHAAVIDLGGVTASDSSGLALLIEWLSMAVDGKHALRYENVPSQLQQLARLSDVDELLLAPVTPAAAVALDNRAASPQ